MQQQLLDQTSDYGGSRRADRGVDGVDRCSDKQPTCLEHYLMEPVAAATTVYFVRRKSNQISDPCIASGCVEWMWVCDCFSLEMGWWSSCALNPVYAVYTDKRVYKMPKLFLCIILLSDNILCSVFSYFFTTYVCVTKFHTTKGLKVSSPH